MPMFESIIYLFNYSLRIFNESQYSRVQNSRLPEEPDLVGIGNKLTE